MSVDNTPRLKKNGVALSLKPQLYLLKNNAWCGLKDVCDHCKEVFEGLGNLRQVANKSGTGGGQVHDRFISSDPTVACSDLYQPVADRSATTRDLFETLWQFLSGRWPAKTKFWEGNFKGILPILQFPAKPATPKKLPPCFLGCKPVSRLFDLSKNSWR